MKFANVVIGCEKMVFFYVMLILGALFVISAVFLFIVIYVDRDYSLLNVVKCIGMLLIGVLLLAVTLPSLKYIVLKEYDVVSGKCVIDINSSGRSSEADFKMLDTDEFFTFRDIPALDAYGKSIPYYCEVTVTKDHMFEIGYKIYDAKTQKLILTSK
ncbi:hypothetical protein [Neobacillus sp. FSL H8-0543]|uniref:hypothetical protein n=1 Tax=Neobacillus sp. FSL H8-0543 TaxID=2954672 RepID=UPI0031587930